MSSNGFLDLSYVPGVLVGRYYITRRFALANGPFRRLIDYIEVVHLESAHVTLLGAIGLQYFQFPEEHLGKTDLPVSQSL